MYKCCGRLWTHGIVCGHMTRNTILTQPHIPGGEFAINYENSKNNYQLLLPVTTQNYINFT